MMEAYIFSGLFGTIRLGFETLTVRAAHPVPDAQTGGATMSVVTFDWAPAETETKTGIPKATENYPRKEEFRLALDRYIADYAAHQRRRAEAIGSTAGTPFISHNLARFAGWLRLWRRPLRATREIW
jgi:hypothetical protein